jgi:hypothetical protein
MVWSCEIVVKIKVVEGVNSIPTSCLPDSGERFGKRAKAVQLNM